ncbi:transcriptional regulator FtsR [Motilibacter deserti]|uniref:MerR family transcriptional regulator n=1 Tax=Motilibacter deserti TaxID=2714956 RepID=A0ABX0GX70_9ACTN|nr:MerR family transcriptional regulator [Motilibacter deserti]NHC14281.1 MerR family transcriptional regulator [Motilibacter deserti]
MSIGEVLAALRQEFSDVTISKIRFLEAEGLVEPQRTASGYRKFAQEDVERLRYVLRAQRDRYLPLRVIKEHLDAIDRGLEPPADLDGPPRAPRPVPDAGGFPGPESFRRDGAGLRLARGELCEAAGIEDQLLREIEGYGLVATTSEGYFDGDALLVAQTVGELARFGVEPRHLRPFKTAADREAGLVEQVTRPLLSQRSPEAQARAEEATRELGALSVRLHALLVKAALHRG